ncbi:hypothetical protein BGZ58_007152 [Dissophora ornata]|nr:hypothetical protein BGZ58_007152 [Dissophora ornata]
MSYITKDQLNLYLQKVSNQSAGAGANGTTRSRSTLNGPRPPTFGAKASSRKIFQDGPPSATLPSPVTPTTAQLDNAVKNLSLSSIPDTPNPQPPSPILESMGESGPGASEPIMESMGSDGYETANPLYMQQYGTMHGQPGYGPGAAQTWSASGYTMGPLYQQPHPGVFGNQPVPPQPYHNYHDHNQQQQHSVHLNQEQYLRLQQQQFQQQEYLRQQHAAAAAAHGYHPVQPSPTHLPSPAGSQMQLPTSTSTPSKTITPRIVPIVEIPKYTIINPPKTEIDDTNEDQDDDWTPEPPPRDVAKKSDAKPSARPPSPRTPIESTSLMEPLPTLNVEIPKKPVSGVSGSPKYKTASQPTTPASIANSMLEEEDRVPLPPPKEVRRYGSTSPTSLASAALVTEDDRVPMPPPREFRRQSSASPTSASSILSVSPSITSTSSSPAKATTPTTSLKKAGVPAAGTVRANSAKFNAMAAASSGKKEPSARSNSMPLPIPAEAYANKELPPILPETLKEQPPIPKMQENQLFDGQPDLEHESKCIVTEEEKQMTIPLADDMSMEAVVEEKEQEMPGSGSAPSPAVENVAPLSKPSRRKSSSATETNQQSSSAFICSSCDEPITGMMITAMGKRWHSDHFVCSVCDLNLEHIQFFQKDGKPYCHLDYHDMFSPKCGHCNSAIENECLTALGKNWHPDHFFCRECGDPFGEDGYMVHDDFPYCEKDYLRLFAPKCTGCQDPIQGDFISALKGKWHRDCFGCTVCHIGFDTASYYVENGKPYCQAHYKSGAQSAAA